MSSKIRHYYAEEVDHLRSSGCGDAEILTALGVTCGALARALYREGRPDIARSFSAQQARENSARKAGNP